jgi:hypothetical protein
MADLLRFTVTGIRTAQDAPILGRPPHRRKGDAPAMGGLVE